MMLVVQSSQGSNPGLPHCRQILYHLSHQGCPRLVVKGWFQEVSPRCGSSSVAAFRAAGKGRALGQRPWGATSSCPAICLEKLCCWEAHASWSEARCVRWGDRTVMMATSLSPSLRVLLQLSCAWGRGKDSDSGKCWVPPCLPGLQSCSLWRQESPLIPQAAEGCPPPWNPPFCPFPSLSACPVPVEDGGGGRGRGDPWAAWSLEEAVPKLSIERSVVDAVARQRVASRVGTLGLPWWSSG